MIANAEFQKQPKMFWAYVRTLSQKLGYTTRKTKQIKIPTVPEIVTGLTALGLDPTKLVKKGTVSPTDLGRALLNYFAYRAEVLNDKVQRQLMNAKGAPITLTATTSPACMESARLSKRPRPVFSTA